MSEDLHITRGNKEEQYGALFPQVKALLEGEPDLVANLAKLIGSIERAVWMALGRFLS